MTNRRLNLRTEVLTPRVYAIALHLYCVERLYHFGTQLFKSVRITSLYNLSFCRKLIILSLLTQPSQT